MLFHTPHLALRQSLTHTQEFGLYLPVLQHASDSSVGHSLLPGRTCSRWDSHGVEAGKGPGTCVVLTGSEGEALKFIILRQVPKIGQSNLTQHPLLLCTDCSGSLG